MKSVEELDHYELLELSPGAEPGEVERAYAVVRAAYDKDSLALYSVFDQRDSGAIRERIDYAYRVLSDERTRKAYDDELGIDRKQLARAAEDGSRPRPLAPPSNAVPMAEQIERAAAVDAHRPERFAEQALPYALASDPTQATFEELTDEESGEFDGPRLRRARLRRGVELDEISQITKVSPRHLESIEEERFDDLPDAVYVRGFVTAYARTLHLDARAVATSFMHRVEAHRSAPPRTGLLGRR